jgi:hypothetical protein
LHEIPGRHNGGEIPLNGTPHALSCQILT